MGKHLRYDLQTAVEDYKKNEHPQVVMKDLGITYQHGLGSSMGACWIFWNCENIPNDLPEYLKQENNDPLTWVGYGLSEETANKIANHGR